MKYKLICLDMDGTLLNSQKKISERNLIAIKKANDLGVKIAVCTGRIFTSAYYYSNMIGVKTPIIASNGSYIREKDSNDVIYKSVLGMENCYAVLKILQKHKIVPHFFTSNSIYAEKLVHFSAHYNDANKTMPKENKVWINITNQWDEVFKKNELEIIKAVAADDDLDKIRKAKEELKSLNILEVVSSSKNNFEVMCKGSSKGRATQILADFYSITPEEVICMGDNENDISMIKFAGLGVAMANGEDCVKEIATYVTTSNDEDGVAEVIEKFVLKENI